ncbi:putative porin [Elusimicrobiota bacterium]
MRLFFLILVSFILLSNVNIMFGAQVDLLTDRLVKKGLISQSEADDIKKESGRTLNIKGDLRLRHQTDWSPDTAAARNRMRIRLRLGFASQMNDKFLAKFGLATGSETIGTGITVYDNDPASTNHTLSGFGKSVLMVDYVYIGYLPIKEVTVCAGKIKNPIFSTTDLLWDTDINPDGVAIKYQSEISSNVKLFFTPAWFIISEIKPSLTDKGEDADVCVFQPGLSVKLPNSTDLKIGLAYYMFNVKNKSLINFGTPTIDYKCFVQSVNLSFKNFYGFNYSLGLFCDIEENLSEDVNENGSGRSFGVKYGDDKIESFGQWQIKYIDRFLGANSWLDGLGDSDAYDGQVDSYGREIVFKFGLDKATTFVVDYYHMDTFGRRGSSIGPNATTLVQCDVVHKFK